MRILLIQPPFTQLNAPYPAIHYLDRFLRDRGYRPLVQDHSIALYRLMMTKPVVRRFFQDARKALDQRGAPDAETERQLERYFSYSDRYAAWAEPLVRFLSDGDPALAFRISRVPDDLPRGERAQRFLEERDESLRPEEAPLLAIHILDDLGDFISFALDPEYSTVRYAERIASSRAEYLPISEAADSGYLMKSLYRPWLRETFREIPGSETPELALLTVPFPGCLVGAIAAAREARAVFGPGLCIAMGGGYVSTELRDISEKAFFDDVDALCFDAGYGALTSLIEGMEAGRKGCAAPPLYRAAHRTSDGTILYSGFPVDEAVPPGLSHAPDSPAPGRVDCLGTPEMEALEREALRSVFPDYRNADMRAYVRTPSSANPMHRIWADAPWLKYQLASGCYWRRCAFCDTQLDYVRRYQPSDAGALMAAASEASERTGLTGIHFTDEALPLPGLLEFARLNRGRDTPFTFWGNVRFDRAWTEDRCALLAFSGLVAVSGGIEIATERGLAMTGKGFTLPSLVRTLAAFKRNGILTHGYLIYGFPEETEEDLVDSAEAVRQLFAAGLLDSAFWHRFVLTRHSEMYTQWRAGRRPGLAPIDKNGSFASNDLEFQGSERWNPYDEPLESLLAAWMAGEGLDRPVPPLLKGGPRPTLSPTWAEDLLRAAEGPQGEPEPFTERTRVHWVAGLPAVKRRSEKDAVRVEWTDRGRPEGLTLSQTAAIRLTQAITDLAGDPEGRPLTVFLEEAGLSGALDERLKPSIPPDKVFRLLRGNGLVAV